MAPTQLDLVVQVLDASKPTLPVEQRIVSDNTDLIRHASGAGSMSVPERHAPYGRVALDCAYACASVDEPHINMYNEIFGCLPARKPSDGCVWHLGASPTLNAACSPAGTRARKRTRCTIAWTRSGGTWRPSIF